MNVEASFLECLKNRAADKVLRLTKAYSMTKKEKYFFGMQTGVTGSRKQFSGSRRKGMVPWKLRKHENVSYNLIFIYSHRMWRTT